MAPGSRSEYKGFDDDRGGVEGGVSIARGLREDVWTGETGRGRLPIGEEGVEEEEEEVEVEEEPARKVPSLAMSGPRGTITACCS